MTTPADVLTLARDLLRRPEARTAGYWPRASALLARQALEMALDDFWRSKRPGVEQASMLARVTTTRTSWPRPRGSWRGGSGSSMARSAGHSAAWSLPDRIGSP
jgi:hypothetical protein